MHVDGEGHGQDDEFTAGFEERYGASAHEAGDPEPKDGDQPADPPEGSADTSGAEPAPGDEAKPDPWAGASPEAIAERDRLRHADASHRGRISALQRQLSQRQEPAAPPPAKSEPPQGQEEGGDGGEKTPQQVRAERIATLREEYPDVAAPILDMLEEAQAQIAELTARTKPVIDGHDEAAVQRQEQLLAAKHPDWATVAKDATFLAWANAQPDEIKSLVADSFDAADVSAVLTLYKTEQAAKAAADPDPGKGADPKPGDQTQRDEPRRTRQLDGGRERPSRGAPAAAGAPDDFEGSFEFFRQKRERQAAGR